MKLNLTKKVLVAMLLIQAFVFVFLAAHIDLPNRYVATTDSVVSAVAYEGDDEFVLYLPKEEDYSIRILTRDREIIYGANFNGSSIANDTIGFPLGDKDDLDAVASRNAVYYFIVDNETVKFEEEKRFSGGYCLIIFAIVVMSYFVDNALWKNLKKSAELEKTKGEREQ